ncbi:MAG TPA: tetratricopeptide repeat protein [Candidatus Angelobacter sp.]
MTKRTSPVRLLSLMLVLLTLVSQEWATCGGGGGGGMGGMSGGGSGSNQETYPVPWKLVQPSDPPPAQGLAVYWLPSSQAELEKSSLRFSRILSLYSQQCVSMGIVDSHTALGKKFIGDQKPPVAVLAAPDGKLIAKAENKDGFLKVDQVEKLLEAEMKSREEAVKREMDAAKEKAKGGDSQGAIQLYRSVYEQKCMFPGKAKDAAKELKKLGVTVADVPDGPIFDQRLSAQIERVMRNGLKAENAAQYVEAEHLYTQAHNLDPADPAPLRYLGELYRHHIGDWEKARHTFDAILNMPADPISRAVALHGLGKMTIHEGDFKKGLALMEASVTEFPIVLAYRNLAVYWNSEGDAAKTDFYVQKALALDPKDPYNLVFAAAFMAQNGHGDEALKIARQNEKLLPASYNLAAVFAQAGQKEKALGLLKRHFFEYERYQAVRSKEMMEARVDAVFASLREDPSFMALTGGADGKLPLPMNSSKPAGTQ